MPAEASDELDHSWGFETGDAEELADGVMWAVVRRLTLPTRVPTESAEVSHDPSRDPGARSARAHEGRASPTPGLGEGEASPDAVRFAQCRRGSARCHEGRLPAARLAPRSDRAKKMSVRKK
ncbi:hypothetical protein NL676_024607 [Syzygium grande]|nr:hypothetical protein NL676_024607 [Syzygium grande]